MCYHLQIETFTVKTNSMKFYSTIIVVLSLMLVNIIYVNNKNEEASNTEFINFQFEWSGDWIFQTDQIRMNISIDQLGLLFNGHHCFVDGRIIGGANDCSILDENNNPTYTLTNSQVISDNIIQFDFRSGFTASNGKARLIKVNNNSVRFIVTEEPTRFHLSPLGNYLQLNNGIGENVNGGVVLLKN